jgi:hypothetical protein
MKNLVIIFAIVGSMMIPHKSEAQRYGSDLVLTVYDNSLFTVIFDRKIYDNPVPVFRLSNITPGNHRLIMKRRVGGPHGAYRTLYDGNIHIPENSEVTARINKFNELVVNSRQNYSRNEGYHEYEGGHQHGYYDRPLLDLDRLINSIRNASFENDKKIIAEQAISSNRVKADQIYQILLQFSFESTRLSVAKFAYRFCEDKRNYYIVNDAFTFSSSRRELSNYIGNYRSDYYDDDWNYYNNDHQNHNNNNSYNNRW